MRLLYRIVFIFLIGTLTFTSSVYATHVAGADITYENVGQDSFLVTLNVFRDCGGVNLNTNNIQVSFVSDCGQTFTQNMTLLNGPNGTEVSQLCASQIANSTCNGGTLPGIQHYIFQEIVVLSPACDAWNMSWTFSARNSATNLVGQDDLHVSASLNSATDPTNSSPNFNNSPIPFVCLNAAVNYNFGVLEPDGDSLYFELTDPMIDATTSVTWQPGFSANNPINGISINSGTGQLTFTPTTQGNYVIAVKVCEYDAATGVLLGCVVRDIQLIAQNCFNLPPENTLGGIVNGSSNAVTTGNDTISVCEGELLTFDVVYIDNDSVVVVDLVSDVSNVLPGATSTYVSAGDTGILSISWQVPSGASYANTFAVQAQDNVCPVPGIASHSYTVLVNPQTIASNDTTICLGGSANVSVSGGNTFFWTVLSGDPIDTVTASPTFNASCNDCTQPIFTPNVTTTYVVTSDVTGPCSNTDTVVVTVTDLALTLSDTVAFCPGDSVLASATSTGTSYSWSNGVTLASTYFDVSSTYYVTATGASGCTQTDSVYVKQNTPQGIDLGEDIVNCIGTTFSVVKDLGPDFVSYLWHDGSTNQTYTVTELNDTVWAQVEDTNGCISSDTLLVIQVSPPVVDLGNDTAFCDGESHVLRAPPGMTLYTWNVPNGNVDTLLVGSADTISVVVTDSNSCQGLDIIIIDIDTLPIPDLGADFNKCVEDTVTLDAGLGYLTYAWSTGATTQTILADQPAGYVVTVTDSNNCVGSNGVTITNDTVPSVYIGPDDSICDGSSIILNAGGGYSSYLWSNGLTTQTALYDSASTPWVIITDANGCEGADTMTLSIMSLPTVVINDVDICAGDSTVLDAGPNMVSYNWNTGDTTQTITVMLAGAYSVTVQDSNGCENADTATVGINALPTPVLPADIPNCTGSTFSQLVDAGAGYVLYNWMDGTFTQIRNATQNDTLIWVEVTDTNNCVGADTMYVVHLPLPSVNIGPDDSICAAQSYSLNAGTGGGAIASYLWTTGATSQSITIPANPGLPADVNTVYAVTVTDTVGCTNSDNMNLLTWALPEPVLPADTNFCTGDPFGMVLNPGAFAAYAWSTGATTPTITIGPLGNTYSVTVTDGNGCSNDTAMVVTEFSVPNPNLGPDVAYCEGSNFSQVLNPGNFTTYLWSDGSKGKVLGVTTAGTYSVTVSNTNGCVNSDDIIITENPAPPVDLGGNQFFCEDADVNTVLDATTMLPGGGYSFLWSNGATTGTILVNAFGAYTVTVTNQTTGCTGVDVAQVIPFPKAQPDLGDDSQICAGQVITLDPKVTIPGYNYLWSTGATTPTISVIETGTYWVVLNADNGSCTDISDTVEFTLGVLPVVELGEDQYLCEGQTAVLLNNSTPFPNATYLWQDGVEKMQRNVTETGNYEIAVTNTCGTVYDQVYIEFQDCFGVYVPNTFTPNNDGVNDVFTPESDQEFREYGLWIYNRWGKLVFKTNQPNHGWDGTINGELAPVDVYVWRISYVSGFQTFGTRTEKVGEVNLLR